jgi:hypothetical protein
VNANAEDDEYGDEPFVTPTITPIEESIPSGYTSASNSSKVSPTNVYGEDDEEVTGNFAGAADDPPELAPDTGGDN